MKKKQQKLTKFFAVLFLLIIVCIIPLLTHYWSDLHHTVTVTPTNLDKYDSIQLHDDVEVEQLIYLQGSLRSLSIYLTPSNMPDKKAVVQVSIKQNNANVYSFSIPSTKVTSGLNTFELPGGQFKEGTATIRITAEGCTKNNAAVIYTSNDFSSGLPEATVNGKVADSPLSITYTILSIFPLFTYTTALLVLLLLLCVGVSVLFVYKMEWLENHNLLLYIIAFLIIVIIIGIRQPVASFYGEPISETAYDFWYGQISKGLSGSLMTLEAGLYLSWMERLITFIAVKLFPTKYVFVGMQMIMTFFIAGVSAAFCLKNFTRYFSPLVQLLIALFVGVYLYLPEFYMFHTLGYWGIIFIICFCLYDMDKMSLPVYIGGFLLTVVICLSKLMYVALLPVAIFILLVTMKKHCLKFKLYWATIIPVNLFHICYVFYKTSTVIENRQGLGSFHMPAISRLVENVIYYQVQFLNSIVTGMQFKNGLMNNVIFTILLVGIASVLLHQFFVAKKLQSLIGFLICCGLFSLGTIGVDILASAGTVNMSAKVDWSKNLVVYNQHYIFLYVSLAFMLLGALYWFENYVTHYLTIQQPSYVNTEKVAQLSVLTILTFLILHFAPYPDVRIYTNIEEFPTEWKLVWQAVNNNAYYLPINVGYPNALISLQHNSLGVLLGFNLNDQWSKLAHLEKFDDTKPYYSAPMQDLKDSEILSVTVRKANNNFRTSYTMVEYDKNNNVIASVPQSNSDYREWITFYPETPIIGAIRLEFVYSSTGTPAYVKDALNIGVKVPT